MTRLTTAEKVELLEYAAELLDNDEEQTSGTDVLPTDQVKSDCSGCPLHEHKSDLVSVELTKDESSWLQILVLCSTYVEPGNVQHAINIYDKLKKLTRQSR